MDKYHSWQPVEYVLTRVVFTVNTARGGGIQPGGFTVNTARGAVFTVNTARGGGGVEGDGVAGRFFLPLGRGGSQVWVLFRVVFHFYLKEFSHLE